MPPRSSILAPYRHHVLPFAGQGEAWARRSAPPLQRQRQHTGWLAAAAAAAAAVPSPPHAGPSRLASSSGYNSHGSSHSRPNLSLCPDQRQRYLSIRRFFTHAAQQGQERASQSTLPHRSIRALHTSPVHHRRAQSSRTDADGSSSSSSDPVQSQHSDKGRSNDSATPRSKDTATPHPPSPPTPPPPPDHRTPPPPDHTPSQPHPLPHPHPHPHHHLEPYHHPDISSAFANYPKTLRKLALRAITRPPYPPNTPTRPLPDAAHPAPSASRNDAPPPPSLPPPPTAGTGTGTGMGMGTGLAATSPALRRPSKEELLRYARGFWTRLRIRFKWFTIRGFRRFNADDFSAFFTLGGLGTILLIVVGTTTAVSIVLWGLDMLNMQKWIARKIADYLTAQTGVTVVFESAIVPKWKDSRICFQNVFITRRANANDPESLRLEREKKRRARLAQERRANARSSRRSTASTAGMGMAWEGITADEYLDDEAVAPPLPSNATGEDLSEEEKELVNTNFTMFDLNVDSIDVTLSISRWFDGKSLVEDAVVKGVRGIIDRRNVVWDPDQPYDPRAARRFARPGDFELESLEVHDLLVTIYQPSGFRPFNFSIFNASVPKLRKQWLFYDLLSAESITGQVDGCLFSLHKPQSIGRTTEKERALSQESGRWRTISRLRIDGVNIDHIQSQSNLGGPLSWILSGRFDVVADIRFPRDSAEDVDINTIIAEIVDNLTNAVAGSSAAPSPPEGTVDADDARSTQPIPGQHKLNEPAIEAPLTTVGPAAERAWRESVRASGLDEGGSGDEDGAGGSDEERSGGGVGARRRKFIRALSALAGEAGASGTGGTGGAGGADEADRASTGVAEADGDGIPHGRFAEEELQGEGEGPNGCPDDAASEAATASAVAAAVSETGAAVPATPPPPPSVVIDLDVRFKDIKAAVPLFDSQMTYSRQAFVRPIVAFMNANRTLIPVHCRVVMDLSEFDGSMDLAQTGLLPLISEKLYDAMAHHVTSANANSARLKSVSIWSLKSTLQVALKLAKQLRDSMSGVKGVSAGGEEGGEGGAPARRGR